MFLRRLIVCVALLGSSGCGDSAFKQRDHELEYCGIADSEEGCDALGCDVAISGRSGRVEGNSCTSTQTTSMVCFINHGKQPVMSWGNAVTTYVRESEVGGFDVLELSAVYDDALPSWRSCLEDGFVPECNVCRFP